MSHRAQIQRGLIEGRGWALSWGSGEPCLPSKETRVRWGLRIPPGETPSFLSPSSAPFFPSSFNMGAGGPGAF